MKSEITYTVEHGETTDPITELFERFDAAVRDTEGATFVDSDVKVDIEPMFEVVGATEVTYAWFLNEENVPYRYPVDDQWEEYPNDDHVPYATREDAEVAAILNSLKPNPWRRDA